MLKDKIVGEWETYDKIVSVIDIVLVIEFIRDGSVVATVNYKHPILKAAMALWNLKIKGSWHVGIDEKLRLNLQGISTYPTRLVDQVLKTFKIQVSVDEFVSILSAALFSALGADGNESAALEFSDENTMIGADGKTIFHRRR
jgi:hypothetical protein